MEVDVFKKYLNDKISLEAVLQNFTENLQDLLITLKERLNLKREEIRTSDNINSLSIKIETDGYMLDASYDFSKVHMKLERNSGRIINKSVEPDKSLENATEINKFIADSIVQFIEDAG